MRHIERRQSTKHYKQNRKTLQKISDHQLGRAVDINIDPKLKALLDKFQEKIQELGLWSYTYGNAIHVAWRYNEEDKEEKVKAVEAEYNKLIKAIEDREATTLSFYLFLSDPWFTYGPLYML